jgi:8-oxo-dGTP pyrophosphatase MutT (NUDIX family)
MDHLKCKSALGLSSSSVSVSPVSSSGCDSPVLPAEESLTDKLDQLSIAVPIPVRASDNTRSSRRKGWRFSSIKKSVFVFLTNPNMGLYSLINRQGQFGVPGGKMDASDRGIWESAHREFFEETGGQMPLGHYDHFEWGDGHHTIRVYYRSLTDIEARSLPVGPSPDPEGSEVEIVWVSVNKHNVFKYRNHLQKALRIYRAVI